jgi:tetratricopeptide (TPR) repeat protein
LTRLRSFALWTLLPILGLVGAFGWVTLQVKGLRDQLATGRVELATVRTEAAALSSARTTLDAELKRLREEREQLVSQTESLRNELGVERQKLADAKRVADVVQELALGAKTPEQRARTLYAAARNAMELRDFVRARTLLKATIDENPADADAFNSLGLVTARLEPDWHRAEEYYLRAAQINPRQVYALHNLADLYSWHNEKQKAREFAERALAVRPDYGPAKLLLEKLSAEGRTP